MYVKNNLKIYLILLASAIVLFSGLNSVQAANDDAIDGFAWSQHYGYIFMNCTETGSCDTNDPANPGLSYGVDMDETTGALSGYAWSPNAGWFVFDSVCGQAPYIDLNTGNAHGFMRWLGSQHFPASDKSGGINGCVKLRHVPSGSSVFTGQVTNTQLSWNPPVTMDLTTGELSGYGWDGVDSTASQKLGIGWVDFGNVTIDIPPPSGPQVSVETQAVCRVDGDPDFQIEWDSVGDTNCATTTEYSVGSSAGPWQVYTDTTPSRWHNQPASEFINNRSLGHSTPGGGAVPIDESPDSGGDTQRFYRYNLTCDNSSATSPLVEVVDDLADCTGPPPPPPGTTFEVTSLTAAPDCIDTTTSNTAQTTLSWTTANATANVQCWGISSTPSTAWKPAGASYNKTLLSPGPSGSALSSNLGAGNHTFRIECCDFTNDPLGQCDINQPDVHAKASKAVNVTVAASCGGSSAPLFASLSLRDSSCVSNRHEVEIGWDSSQAAINCVASSNPTNHPDWSPSNADVKTSGSPNSQSGIQITENTTFFITCEDALGNTETDDLFVSYDASCSSGGGGGGGGGGGTDPDPDPNISTDPIGPVIDEI